jgi:hypothetical protein
MRDEPVALTSNPWSVIKALTSEETEMKCPACGRRTLANIGVCKFCGAAMPSRRWMALRFVPHFLPALLGRLSLKGRFIAGIALLVLLCLVLFFFVLPKKIFRAADPKVVGYQIAIEKMTAGQEIAANAVFGRVIGSHRQETGEGTMTVKSSNTGEIYTFNIGGYTSYHPRRYPALDEQVKVYYFDDKGVVKATQVQIGR